MEIIELDDGEYGLFCFSLILNFRNMFPFIFSINITKDIIM